MANIREKAAVNHFKKNDDLDIDYVVIVKHDLKGEFVRLRFTQDDEFALINKGIANPSDEEYVAYREYVNACKVVVDEYPLG